MFLSTNLDLSIVGFDGVASYHLAVLLKRRLTISILASIAQFERELILSRISEGRKRARRNGTKFGRRPKLTAYQR
jgi:DNA invertase Pin-like site-specific DNA recombinase